MSKSMNMTDGSPFDLLLRFTLPALAGNLLHQVYAITDGIVVGKCLGDTALGAVGCTAPITMLLASLMIGVNVGVGVIISQYFGQNDFQGIRRAFVNSLYLGLVISAILAAAGLMLTEPILRWMNTPDGPLADAVTYLRINFLTCIFPLLYYLFSSAFRGLGDSQTALYCLVISVLANIAMDVLFVAVFGWGVAGSAWATALAQGLSALFAAVLLYRRYQAMRFRAGELAFDLSQFIRITALALPIALQSAFNNLGNLAAQAGVNSFGETAMTAYTAAGRLGTLALMPLETVGSSLSVFAAQNHGAGRVNRVRDGIRAAQKLVLITGAALGLLLALFGRMAAYLFLKQPQAAVLDIVHSFLLITAVPGILAGFMHIYQQTLRGVNLPGQALAGGIMQLAAKIAAVSLGAWIFRSLYVVWLGWPLSFLAGTIIPYISCRRYLCGQSKLSTS